MIRYFSKLSAEQVRKFGLFVVSPYHNSNKKVVKLFRYLNSLHPDITVRHLEKKVISRYVFRNQKYNDANVRKVISDFNLVFLSFLKLISQEKKRIDRIEILKPYLDHRDSVKLIRKMNVMNKVAEGGNVSKDTEYYIETFRRARAQFELALNSANKDSLKALSVYVGTSGTLALYVELQSLFYYHVFKYLIPDNSDIHKNINNTVLETVKSNLETFRKDHPEIYILYQLINYYETESDSYFYDTEKYYNRNRSKFRGELLRQYLEFHYSFYADKLYRGIGDADENRDCLYKFFNAYYVRAAPVTEVLENGFIHFNSFLTAVNVGSALNRNKWVQKFIERNKRYLSPDTSVDIIGLSNATLHFNMKKYKEAFESLAEISNKISQIYINAKILKAQIYFENGDTTGFESMFANLDQLIKNKKANPGAGEFIKVFIKYFLKLAAIKELKASSRHKAGKILLTEIKKETKFIPKSSWIIAKVSELTG
ncbi:MAG: hypothetical protein ABI528_11605 [bacterium]